ncbi:MAG TPA: CDGSH iron-sulfur domain-containing protein [Holophagaceae bacterium]|jgi:CDGSH-type Zn-finger protein|nr:CDGSH iron-sulfur domain-containing protein [Holophagaceae bacterium]
MSEPHIAKREPAGLTLEPGTYLWCVCGLSATQPFCDGHHKGTEFRPHKLVIAETQEVWLCQCKHTHTPPFCDGTHETLK